MAAAASPAHKRPYGKYRLRRLRRGELLPGGAGAAGRSRVPRAGLQRHAQILVQLHAPPHIRGRVLGLYAMSALGLRTFACVTVGVGGSLVGIHWSLAVSAATLLALLALGLALATRWRY
jgi:hypothetical protein